MAERQPISFDHEAAKNALSADGPTAITDTKHGDGTRFTTETGARLEVYPAAVRLSTPDMTVEVTGDPLAAEVGPRWVLFRGTTEDGITRVAALRDTGEIRASRTAPQDVYRAEQAEQEEAEQLPAGNTEPGAQPERGEQVSFRGNLGRKPRAFEVGGNTRVKLLVAEHRQADEEEEQTTWHEVWTTDKLGPKVAGLVEQGVLKQGVEVNVKGYQHRHKPKEGQTEGDLFVRAFMVNPVRQRQPRASK